MGNIWLRRLSPHFENNHECGHDMGNSVANIQLRRRSHILPIYCANVGSVANILPIYCPYTVANIWAPKSFLGGYILEKKRTPIIRLRARAKHK